MNGVSHTQASDEMLQGEALRGPQPVRGVLTLAFRLVWEWWPHVVVLAVACGVVAATITGAIGVGDAMQAGLRRLAIGRLGQIDSAVLGDDFFRATLAREMVATDALPIDPRSGLHSIPPATLVPAIVLEVTVDVAKGGLSPQHSGRATLLACNELDSLGYAVESHAALTDQDQTVAMNAVLAESLGVRVGDAIVPDSASRGTGTVCPSSHASDGSAGRGIAFHSAADSASRRCGQRHLCRRVASRRASSTSIGCVMAGVRLASLDGRHWPVP